MKDLARVCTALKYFGGSVIFRLRECLKDATKGASFISFGRLFHAHIVEGKNEYKKRLVLAMKF